MIPTALTLFLSLYTMASVQSEPTTEVALPGYADETQRYFVVFKERSFDLGNLRNAILRANTAKKTDSAALTAVDRIVARLQNKARTEHAGFATFASEKGVRVLERYWLVDAWLVEVKPEVLGQLRTHAAVASLQADRYLAPGAILTATNAKNHRVDALQKAGVKGKGVTIAIVDSGLDMVMGKTKRPHNTFYVNGNPKNTTGGGLLGSRVLGNYKIGLQPAEDALPHGTGVAAVAAGEKWNKNTASDRGHAPMASIVGYSIADLRNGLAKISTMVRAWQKVVADTAKHKIRVGNMSYDGSTIPTAIEEQAMDRAVLTADLFITVSGGNYASQSHYAHGATNILAVGSVVADTHKVSTFSTRGPLWSDRARNYPHIVANGESIVMPAIDDNSLERTRTGTSYAAPQVSGAAALYRSIKVYATALETRAAVLATTEDISGKNRAAPYNSVNAYGFGYLRDDRLMALAQNRLPNAIINSVVRSPTKTLKGKFKVTKGKHYAAVLTWNRLDTTKKVWSNLDLTVMQGNKELGASRSPRNTNEKVVFRALATGTVDIVLTVVSMTKSAIPIALVVCEALPPFEKGMASNFGVSCGTTSSRIPVLGASAAPEIGVNYSLLLASADPNSVAGMVFGLSDKTYGAIKLPFDLKVVGAPGCHLYSSLDFVTPVTTSFLGIGLQIITIPKDRSLIYLKYYHQALIVSPKANSLGLTFTHGIALRIGGQ